MLVRRREQSAGETGAADRAERSVRHRGQDAPFRCSRGPMSARKMSPWMQKRARPLGRRHGCSAPGRKSRHCKSTEPEYPSPVLPAAYAATPAQRQNRTITSHKLRTSGMARSNPSIRKILAIRLSGRSLRPSTRLRRRAGAAHSQGWDGDRCSGAGAGRDGDGCLAYRTYVGSPRSGEPPIITADNSATKVVPTQSDGDASKAPGRIPPGDGGEKLVSRDEAPDRRQFQVRRVARGISAAEPEQQPSAGCERFSHRPGADDGRERHNAEQRAAPDQDARREGRSRGERWDPDGCDRTRKTGPDCPIGVRANCSGPA